MELKYKDGDEPFIEFPSANTHELLVFTSKSQVYKCKVAAFEDTKSAQLGSYLRKPTSRWIRMRA